MRGVGRNGAYSMTDAAMHDSTLSFPPAASRVEMLCYLIVLQLVTVAHTRTWLTVPHLQESIQLWCARTSTRYDARECRALACLSMQLAPELSTFAPLLDAVRLGKMLSDWRLNDDCPTVMSIRNICAAVLRRRSNSLP